MAAGIASAITRSRTRPLAASAAARASPITRSQPTCRLGRAAYWLVNMVGWSTRYACEATLTVSVMPRPASRGGATG
jgi:hypothetical protein